MKSSSATALALCIALGVGCSGAQFNVHVRDAREPKPIREASVLLYGAADDVCGEGASGGKRSDSNGDAWVEARWCGAAKIVVAARDYAPATREFDSCQTRAIVVDLTRFTPEPSGYADPAAALARDFLMALLSHDSAGVERRLEDPSQAALYTAGGVTASERPDAVRFAGIRPGTEPLIGFDFFYEKGCRESWLVRLVSRDDSFRVKSVSMGSLPPP